MNYYVVATTMLEIVATYENNISLKGNIRCIVDEFHMNVNTVHICNKKGD